MSTLATGTWLVCVARLRRSGASLRSVTPFGGVTEPILALGLSVSSFAAR